MESLRIDTGVKRVMINDDPNRVIVFNPSDVAFAERFYGLMREFGEKRHEYDRRANALGEVDGMDAAGLPENMGDYLALLREICEYLHGQIDFLFGAGTSLKVFEGALSLDAIQQFLEGITPFVQAARSEKMTHYLNNKLGGRVMK